MNGGPSIFKGTDYQCYCAAIRLVEVYLDSQIRLVKASFEIEEDFTVVCQRTNPKNSPKHTTYYQSKAQTKFNIDDLKKAIEHYIDKCKKSRENYHYFSICTSGNLSKNVLNFKKCTHKKSLIIFDKEILDKVSVKKIPSDPYVPCIIRDLLFKLLHMTSGKSLSHQRLDKIQLHFIDGLRHLSKYKKSITKEQFDAQLQLYCDNCEKSGTYFGKVFDRELPSDDLTYQIQEEPSKC